MLHLYSQILKRKQYKIKNNKIFPFQNYPENCGLPILVLHLAWFSFANPVGLILHLIDTKKCQVVCIHQV